MARRIRHLFVILALLGWPQTGHTQQLGASDPEVAKGILQVEEGDYDAGILTLDRAARRLAADPSQTKALSEAYLYLGIAYLGKGHEAAAKAKFRDAIGQIRDLTLSPEDFPPKVIDLFEQARQEAKETPTPPAKAPAKEERPAEAQPERGKKGSKTWILLGGGAAGAAGAVLAASGGSKAEPQPAAAPPELKAQFFHGEMNRENPEVALLPGPAGSQGPWEAVWNWTNEGAPGTVMRVWNPAGAVVSEGQPVSSRGLMATWPGEALEYKIVLRYDPGQPGPAPGPWELKVTYPAR